MDWSAADIYTKTDAGGFKTDGAHSTKMVSMGMCWSCTAGHVESCARVYFDRHRHECAPNKFCAADQAVCLVAHTDVVLSVVQEAQECCGHDQCTCQTVVYSFAADTDAGTVVSIYETGIFH